MNRNECLTITTNYSAHKRTAIETITYELLCTSESGDTRIIDVIEVEKIGKKKPTYRHQHRRMALPEGKYLNLSGWLAIPSIGTSFAIIADSACTTFPWIPRNCGCICGICGSGC